MITRRIYLAPTDTDLTELQVELVEPMPNTSSDTKLVVDVLADGFEAPQDWQLIYEGTQTEDITPLDMEALYPYLLPVNEYDEDGDITGTSPAPHKVPHSWAGWPEL